MIRNEIHRISGHAAKPVPSLFTLGGLLGLLAFSGCAVFSPPRGGTDYGSVDLTADSLVAIVNRQALSLGGVRGSGDLVVRTAEYPKGRKVDVSLVARRPESVRVRGRVGILASIFDFLADADSLRLYLPQESALVAVPNEAGGRALSIVASRELVEALLPALLEADATGQGVLLHRDDDGSYDVTRRTFDTAGRMWTRELRYEPERLRLVRARILRGDATTGSVYATVSYSAHRWTGFAWFPGRISMELPEEEQGLDLTFETFEPNPPIAPELFTMTVPRGTRRLGPDDLTDDFLIDAPSGE